LEAEKARQEVANVKQESKKILDEAYQAQEKS
jgi:hypothetical protein